MWFRELLKKIVAYFHELSHNEERVYRIFQENDISRKAAKKENLKHCSIGDHRMFRTRPNVLQCVDCGYNRPMCDNLCEDCKYDCYISESFNRKLPDE